VYGLEFIAADSARRAICTHGSYLNKRKERKMNNRKNIKRAALVACALAIAGWASNASASDFTKALTKDYFEIARLDYYYSDDRFAVKGRAADSGINVLPDDPDQQKVPAASIQDLRDSRVRLMAALNGGFRESNPREASRAQTMYDCWLWAVVDAQGRPWNCIDTCRNGFLSAMTAWVPPTAAAPAAAPAVMEQAKPVPPAMPRTQVVFFGWNDQDVTAGNQQMLQAVVENARNRGASQIHLTGHADRSGAARYNMRLSLHRAEAVKAALVKLGVDSQNISVVARGESAPVVNTADGVREPRNRRVGIDF
jgi:OOP family OmpA-OmpF porin